MPQTEDGCDNVRDQFVILLPRATFDAMMRCTSLRSKRKSLPHREGREMHIIFRTILHITSIVLVDLLRREGVIVHLSVYVMVFVPMVRQDLEERAAPGTWATKND